MKLDTTKIACPLLIAIASCLSLGAMGLLQGQSEFQEQEDSSERINLQNPHDHFVFGRGFRVNVLWETPTDPVAILSAVTVETEDKGRLLFLIESSLQAQDKTGSANLLNERSIGRHLRGKIGRIGQFCGSIEGGGAFQGALVARTSKLGKDSHPRAFQLTGVFGWRLGGAISPLRKIPTLNSNDAIFDSYLVVNEMGLNERIGVLCLHPEDRSLCVWSESARGAVYTKLLDPSGGVIQVQAGEEGSVGAEFEMGYTKEGAPFVVGFVQRSSSLTTFAFHPDELGESLRTSHRSASAPFRAELSPDARNRLLPERDDRFFLSWAKPTYPWLEMSELEPNQVVVGHPMVELFPPGHKLHEPVRIEADVRVGSPTEKLTGRTEALGVTTTSDGLIGAVATVRRTDMVRHLSLLGFAWSSAEKKLLLRARIDFPFTNGSINPRSNVLVVVPPSDYFLVGSTTTGYRSGRLELPGPGAISLVHLIEDASEVGVGTVLKSSAMTSLTAEEYFPKSSLLLKLD